nr:3763_t:CDS:10 [Entrophospora candida]
MQNILAKDESLTSTEIKQLLRESIIQCSERGLYFSAKWAAETLSTMDTSDFIQSDGSSSMDNSQDKFTPQQNLEMTKIDQLEYDLYLLGKSYFDVKEFDRAAYFLEECKSSKCRFLKIYSKYMAGEKRKTEESNDIMGPLDDSKVMNKEILKLWEEIESWHEEGGLDGFLTYGLLLKQLNPQSENIIDIFIESICKYHYNWSAWLELASCISNQDMLNNILSKLPNTFMTRFFRVHMCVDLLEKPQSLNDLISEFPKPFANNNYLQTEKAVLLYNAGDYVEAEEIFSNLLNKDPFRIDQMDLYSNILYVMEGKSAKLSFLAHITSSTDKFRAETMCVIGNYYSSKSEREKAISYFRRALQIDRSCTAAWTLMGHEDYRAWVGIGQTYEMLKMPFYAIYYYKRSSALRPNDARMWIRLGSIYEQQRLYPEAIKAFNRALSVTDIDVNSATTATTRLAKLYEKIDPDKAAEFHTSILVRSDLAIDTEDIKCAHTFLSFYQKDKGNLLAATHHARNLLEYGGTAKEEAKRLLHIINSLKGNDIV